MSRAEEGYRLGDDFAGTKVIWERDTDHPVFTGKLPAETSQFGHQHVLLPPVQETVNPYQPPRA